MVEYVGYDENTSVVKHMFSLIEKKILFVNHHDRKRVYPDIKNYDIVIHSWMRTADAERIEIENILYDIPICHDHINVIPNTDIVYSIRDIPLIGKKGKQIFVFFDFTHCLNDGDYHYNFAASLIYEVIAEYFLFEENAIKNTVSSFIKAEINKQIEKYKKIQEEISFYFNKIASLTSEKKIINEKICALENRDLGKDIAEITAIKNIPDVARIVPSFRYIIVYTNNIVSYSIDSKKYSFGKFKIIIDTIQHDIILFNLTTARDGYWKPSQHPHVDNKGKACWGNMAETIALLLSEREYSALVTVIIEFLKSVDTSDAAGKYVDRWPVYEEGEGA